MAVISIVIPYYQQSPNILKRALVSILNQQGLPDNTHIYIIIIDDGSPAPLAPELLGLTFDGIFQIKVISQTNQGVAVARNTGLNAVDEHTDYIAFLDSDDIWAENHLTLALSALAKGHDFYFSNNKRRDHHESHFKESCKDIERIASNQSSNNATFLISRDELINQIIKDFPTQASTVVFTKAISRNVRFNETLKYASEDLLFFTQLVASSSSPCFSLDVTVECADGINMYFGNMHWNSPKLLLILKDQIKVFGLLLHIISKDDAQSLATAKRMLVLHQRKFMFLCLRSFIKSKGKIPNEIKLMIKDAGFLPFWLFTEGSYVALGNIFGFYKLNS